MMGYFPNGTSGTIYQEEYCDRCVHMLPERGCPCDTAHMLWNYDECNKKDSILHKMIPINKKGFNEQCIFFQQNELEEPVEYVKSKDNKPIWGQRR
jgi:hypothetical protein